MNTDTSPIPPPYDDDDAWRKCESPDCEHCAMPGNYFCAVCAEDYFEDGKAALRIRVQQGKLSDWSPHHGMPLRHDKMMLARR